jgi:hypothetical protein
MTFSGYNTELTNFAFNAADYGDNSAQIKGVGCAGTNEGVLASKSVFVEPPYIMKGGKRYRRKGMRMRSKGKSMRSKSNKKYRGGSSGYEFTNTPIAPVAGPGAPYSEVKAYNNTLGNYRTVFPPLFKGGKKYTQYGCKNKNHKHYKRGGSKRKTRRTAKRTVKRTSKQSLNAKRALTAKRITQRNWMARRQRMMKGGMNSASDFTAGRNSSQDQPYGNKAISFGQGLNSMLGPNESALASPPPFLPYNNCGKFDRN